jgi:hypothetical protein
MKMNLRTKTSSLLAIALLGLFLSNCKDDGGSTPKAKIELAKLKKEWTIVSVTYNSGANLATDVDAVFNDMTLTISGTYSSAANATYNYEVGGTMPDPSPWPLPGDTDGEWSFVAAEDGLIKRDPNSANDQLGMIYTITDGQLKITFTLTDSEGWPGSKTSAVNGAWEFIFE